MLVWNKQEWHSFCDPDLKMNGGGLDCHVVKPFLSQTQVLCSGFIVWRAKGVQGGGLKERKQKWKYSFLILAKYI